MDTLLKISKEFCLSNYFVVANYKLSGQYFERLTHMPRFLNMLVKQKYNKFYVELCCLLISPW